MSTARASYSEQSFAAVLDDLASGLSLEAACRGDKRPSKSTVQRRIKSDPAFAQAHSEALEARAESRVDKLMQINERLEIGTIDPSSARVILDNLKWLAGKDHPARFSEKFKSEISGPNGVPLIPDTKQPDDLEIAVYLAHVLDRQSRAGIDAQGLPLLGHST